MGSSFRFSVAFLLVALVPQVWSQAPRTENVIIVTLDGFRFQEFFTGAEETLLKVTSLGPNFTEGFINLGVLYIRKEEPDKALAALDRALQIHPDSFAAHFNKGDALTQKGDFQAALAA